jgi:hypothetical protein
MKQDSNWSSTRTRKYRSHNNNTQSNPWEVVATPSNELVLFAGGLNSPTRQPSDWVDIYDVTSESWTTATLSIPRSHFLTKSCLWWRLEWNNTFRLSGYLQHIEWKLKRCNSLSISLLSCSHFCWKFRSFWRWLQSNGYFYYNVVDVFNVTSNT